MIVVLFGKESMVLNENKFIANNEEISLVELILIVWRDKWLIVTTMALSLLLAIAYLLIMPRTVSLSTTIEPLLSTDYDKYAELKTGKSNALAKFAISRSELFNIFIEQMRSRQPIMDSMKNAGLLLKENYSSSEAFDQALSAASGMCSLISFEDKQAKSKHITSKDQMLFECVGNDEDKIRLIMQQSLSLANQQTRDLFKARYLREIAIAERAMQHHKEKINDGIINAKATYTDETNQRVAFLQEQAKIARSMQIGNAGLATQEYTTKHGERLTSIDKTDIPFYLRGYKAIEKEIELIKHRSDETDFIKPLIQLRQEKRMLEQDTMLDRAKRAFNASPVMSDHFTAVFTSLLKSHYQLKPALVIFLSIFIGLILGLLLCFVRAGIQSYKGTEA